MKKLHLIAATLLCGLTVSLSSCIKTDEPAGIEALRGAKAELLQAKAAYEQANAQYRVAEAKIKEAEAAYMEAYYAWQKQEVEQDAKESAEQFNAAIYAYMQATAEAQLAYEKALASINLALATVEDDAVAGALQDLMWGYAFTYVKYTPVVNEAGEIQVIESQGVLKGLAALSETLIEMKEEYAEMLRAKAAMEFAYTTDMLKDAVANQAAIEARNVAAIEKELAALKDVAGVPLEEFMAKYEELQAKVAELENNRQINMMMAIANDAEYKALLDQYTELMKTSQVTSELKLDVPEALQQSAGNGIGGFNVSFSSQDTYFAGMILSLYYDEYVSDELFEKVIDALEEQAVKTESGIVYPNGFSLYLTLAEQKELLNGLDLLLGSGQFGRPDNSDIGSSKIDYEPLLAELTKAEAEWTTAYNNYKAAFEAGKYVSWDYDARTLILNKYLALPEAVAKAGEAAYEAETDAAKKAEAKTKAENQVKMQFITEYKAYLTERTKLDGLKLAEASDITKITDLTTQAAVWTAWEDLTEVERFGVKDEDSFAWINEENAATSGYMGAYWAASQKVGYLMDSSAPKAVVTYEAWCEKGYDFSAVGLDYEGLAAKTFLARANYEGTLDMVAVNEGYLALHEAVKPLLADVTAKLTKLEEELVALNLAMDKIEAKYNTLEIEAEAELMSASSVLYLMETVITELTNTDDYAEAIDKINQRIGEIEGIDYGVTPPEVYAMGELAVAKAKLAYLENMKQAMEDGTYEDELTTMLKLMDEEIKAKAAEVEVLEALFATANAKKDALMATLTE